MFQARGAVVVPATVCQLGFSQNTGADETDQCSVGLFNKWAVVTSKARVQHSLALHLNLFVLFREIVRSNGTATACCHVENRLWQRSRGLGVQCQHRIQYTDLKNLIVLFQGLRIIFVLCPRAKLEGAHAHYTMQCARDRAQSPPRASAGWLKVTWQCCPWQRSIFSYIHPIFSWPTALYYSETSQASNVLSAAKQMKLQLFTNWC